jgi:hypothetical protein
MRLTFNRNKLLMALFVCIQAVNNHYTPEKIRDDFALAITLAAGAVGIHAQTVDKNGRKIKERYYEEE